ncbi:hypothetical protein [Sphingobacterium hotanense]|uniref:hypothetical protein n=1 Tax=Sphingobacterium hotanense TaxID=649196 RepID=UPI0021A87A65|nr:hypothetical protein [Sphingobacterium hotanense]MCT1524151.1 hypothetical protein [Sphingobacterium hotanense]
MKLKNIKAVLIVLLTLGGLGFCGYTIAVFFFENIKKVNPNIVISILGLAVTLITFILTRHYERKKLIEQQIREQKLSAYEQFLEFLFTIFIRAKTGNPLTTLELNQLFYALNQKSILWLSSKSLKAYRKFIKLSLLIDPEELSELAKKGIQKSF